MPASKVNVDPVFFHVFTVFRRTNYPIYQFDDLFAIQINRHGIP